MVANELQDLNTLTAKLETVLNSNYSDPNGPIYQSLRKLLGKCYLRLGRQREAAHSLVEALGPTARTMAAYRTERNIYEGSMRERLEIVSQQTQQLLTPHKEPYQHGSLLLEYLCRGNEGRGGEGKGGLDGGGGHLRREHVRHGSYTTVGDMERVLGELPQEWSVVQVSGGYEASEMWQTQKFISSQVREIYVTVLKGEGEQPFTRLITPDGVKYGERGVFEELYSTLEENHQVIRSTVGTSEAAVRKYWEKRAHCDQNMKGVISGLDSKWLGGWRCLLPGDLLDKSLASQLRGAITQAATLHNIVLSPTQEMLIYKLASCAHLCSPSELSLTLRTIYMEYSTTGGTAPPPCGACGGVAGVGGACAHCDHASIAATQQYRTYRKVFGELMGGIKVQEVLPELRVAKRGPLVLFVDEKLDTFPWEVLPSLNGHPVTRMESLHLAHALYKAQQSHVQGGYYQLRPNRGRYLINPDGDLERMERRMAAFIEYWCPEWEGDRHTQPPPQHFHSYLQDSDIFLYCGHNDGSQYMSGGVERLEGARAVSTLSGCGSVRLRPPGTRLLPLPVHTHYHIATCPCVVGMLWEVTDLEVDKVTSMLLGVFLPPRGGKHAHWGDVGKAKWSQGKIDVGSVEEGEGSKFVWESDLLRAVPLSRRSTSFLTIAASVVVRGLPVAIHPHHWPTRGGNH